jgi:hypothetical protein
LAPRTARVVGTAATADGSGYRDGTASGTVFAFGDAQRLGSNSTPLHQPIAGIASFG